MKNDTAPKGATASAPAKTLPSHIVLLEDWGNRRAGRVFRADADLCAMLDVEKAKYREATPSEISIAGLT